MEREGGDASLSSAVQALPLPTYPSAPWKVAAGLWGGVVGLSCTLAAVAYLKGTYPLILILMLVLVLVLMLPARLPVVDATRCVCECARACAVLASILRLHYCA